MLAARIQAVKINRVWFDQDKVYKCRRWWGCVLILLGNPVLACRQVPVRVLFNGQWIRWEREVKHVLNSEAIESGHVLACNQLRGVPLANWLAESTETKDARLEVLGIAVNALREFHCLTIEEGRAGAVPLSHGDATLNNVLYDQESRSAQWIDFDLRHWLSVPAPQRHADDLRALLFSASCHFSDAEIPELLSVVRQQYDCQVVWNCLIDQLSSRWFRFDVFHRAQIQRGRSENDSAQKLALNFRLLSNLIRQ